MKYILCLLACISIATAQDSTYCGHATRAMRAYEPTRIVTAYPNPATVAAVIVVELGEPGMIDFAWINSYGLDCRPSKRWIGRGRWDILMEVHLMPRGRYVVTARHEATGFAGRVVVWLR